MKVVQHEIQYLWNNYQPIALLLIGSGLTLLLMKIVPGIWAMFIRFAEKILMKWGGSISYIAFRKVYLNWVVMENQDVHLTGTINTGEKPKLEQIFLNLILRREKGESDYKGIALTHSAEKKTFSNIIVKRLEEIFIFEEEVNNIDNELSKKKTVQNETHNHLGLRERFISNKISNFLKYDIISEVTLQLSLVIIFLVAPQILVYGSKVNSFFYGLGIYLFCISIVLGILSFIDNDEFGIMWSLLLFFYPIIQFYNIFKNQILINHQSPSGIIFGVVSAALSILLLAIAIFRGNNVDKYDKYDKYDIKKERTAKDLGRHLTLLNNIAILGKPGSGKSTYLQYLALTFAQEKAGNKRLKKNRVELPPKNWTEV